MTVSQAKGMLRLHEKMVRAYRESGQLENLKQAKRRAEACRKVIRAGETD